MSLSLEQEREFINLITQHQPSLRAYIISLMPGLPGASDILQETNLVLWEKREQFTPGSNFIAWSYTIARFQVKNHRRKLFKQHKLNNTLDEDLAEDLAEFCTSDAQETEKRMRALESCVTNLNREEQELIRHRYMQGDSLNEYAEALGRSAGSLSVSLHRIRQKLRKCIEAKLKTHSFTQ
jgi:RNA polymerase sigma-70 factor (ECF subfamily)